jgi:HAE1 family hydrophobic/amphiphilic exporter-1
LQAEKLREFGVSVTEVVSAVRAQNTTAPVGKVRGELEDQSIRLVGRHRVALRVRADGRQAPRQRGGAPRADRPGQRRLRRDDRLLGAQRSAQRRHFRHAGARQLSTVGVADEARKLVEEIRKELPAGTTLEVTQDGGEEAESSLNNVIHALVFGAGLTVFVVYVFLNSWRSTLITALSLPTSVLAAFIAVWLLRLQPELHEPAWA